MHFLDILCLENSPVSQSKNLPTVLKHDTSSTIPYFGNTNAFISSFFAFFPPPHAAGKSFENK